MVSGAASGLEDEWDKVDVWISVKFDLLRSLGHKSWFCAGCRDQGRTARERSNNGDIPGRVLAAAMRAGLLETGDTMATSRYVVEPIVIENGVHARMFNLAIHHASEGWDNLLDVHLGLRDIWSLPHACGRRRLHTGGHGSGAVGPTDVPQI